LSTPYLSSHLGYTLVQGNDLLVRDGYVWLKSIDQLERVDVIIRRVDDEWCDPLELKAKFTFRHTWVITSHAVR
jgi:uncharacterized circularly permuted ATP-grasp superfamily protein